MMIDFFTYRHNAHKIELVLGAVACISLAPSANTNFATVAISHLKWVPNVACPIIVQSSAYIHTIRAIAFFIYAIRSRLSCKHF